MTWHDVAGLFCGEASWRLSSPPARRAHAFSQTPHPRWPGAWGVHSLFLGILDLIFGEGRERVSVFSVYPTCHCC